MAVGVFDLLHAGHLHYLEQAKALGDYLCVVVAHDDTVRKRKHEPVTGQEMRQRMVQGLKPVDEAIIGNPPDVPIFDILPKIQPNIIALGYDQFAFTYRLEKLLMDIKLDSKIVRLKPYRPDMYKSSILRRKIKEEKLTYA